VKLTEIKSKLKNLENNQEKKQNKNQPAINLGFKLSLDLISPIIVSTLIGLGIDKIFFTKPVFFLIFLLLGIITGFFNIFKSVNKLK
tara:strand:+ start:248 stop:508 length:261 start_codon:yes stop_codon:yes gene_type:complete